MTSAAGARRPAPGRSTGAFPRYLLHHFRRLGGDVGALSNFLGVTRRQLYRKLERSGISLSEAKRELRGG
jgi:DNA-binding NtrC family response regulator